MLQEDEEVFVLAIVFFIFMYKQVSILIQRPLTQLRNPWKTSPLLSSFQTNSVLKRVKVQILTTTAISPSLCISFLLSTKKERKAVYDSHESQ